MIGRAFINLNGVKFRADEITSVTFERDGSEITIKPKKGRDADCKEIGFAVQHLQEQGKQESDD